MKKYAGIIFLFLFNFSIAHADFGIGFTGGFWQMKPDDIQTDLKAMTAIPDISPVRGKVSVDNINQQVQFFTEGQITGGIAMGIMAGFGKTSVAKYNLTFGNPNDNFTNIELSAMEIPASLYFKIAGFRREWGFYVGGGASYVMATAKADIKWPVGTLQGDFGVKKWIPHGLAGLDIFLSRHLAIDINVRYLFSGILEDFRSEIKDPQGASLGECRMIMAKNPSYGEIIGFKSVSTGLINGQRVFKQDFGGPRFNVSLKLYFGR